MPPTPDQNSITGHQRRLADPCKIQCTQRALILPGQVLRLSIAIESKYSPSPEETADEFWQFIQEVLRMSPEHRAEQIQRLRWARRRILESLAPEETADEFWQFIQEVLRMSPEHRAEQIQRLRWARRRILESLAKEGVDD